MYDSGLGAFLETLRARKGPFLVVTSLLLVALLSLVALTAGHQETRTISIHMTDEQQLADANGASLGVAAKPELDQQSVIASRIAEQVAAETDSEIRVDATATTIEKVLHVAIAADEGSTAAIAKRVVDEYTKERRGAEQGLLDAANQSIDLRIDTNRKRVEEIDTELKTVVGDASGAFVDALNVERTLALTKVATLTSERAGNEQYAAVTSFGVVLDVPTDADLTGGLRNAAKSAILALFVSIFLGAAIVIGLSRLDTRVRSSAELSALGLVSLGDLEGRPSSSGVNERFLAASINNLSCAAQGVVVAGVGDHSSAERVTVALRAGGTEKPVLTARPIRESAELLDAGTDHAIILAVRLGKDRQSDVVDAVQMLQRAGLTPMGAVSVASRGRGFPGGT